MSNIKQNREKAIFSVGKNEAYQLHRMRVRKATKAVDMGPPKDRPHVSFDAKKLQLERERQEGIMRDNFILLRKLNDMMCGKLKRKYSYFQEISTCMRTRRYSAMN